jgi:molecular chaperone GrpE
MNNTAQNADDDVTTDGISLGGGVEILSAEEEVDDVHIESYNDDIVGGGEMTPAEHIKRLREKLRDVNAQKQEYLDGWQRQKADYVNYKKREDDNKAEFIKFAREGIITDIIPVLESFHMAFSNKEAWEKVDASWRVGVEYIHTQLLQVLAGQGLSEYNPIGEKYNPNEHTSVGSIESTDPTKDHVIAEVVQLGYRLSGKLIRSPRVKIFTHNV